MIKDEPVAYFDPQKGGFYWAKPTKVTAPVTVDVEPLPLYTKPQTKGCDECGNGGGYALYCLPCAEKFFGKGKEWVGLMRGVRVEGNSVIITVNGGNDESRFLCKELINEMTIHKEKT